MTAEVKLRTLASADTALQAFFGTGPFRFFDRQLPPGYIQNGACCRYRRVSTAFLYRQEGLAALNAVRFQFDVLDLDPQRARDALWALIAWLGTICLAQAAQFSSPTTTPTNFPNFVLNYRAGLEPRTQAPVYAETIDVRIFNLESN